MGTLLYREGQGIGSTRMRIPSYQGDTALDQFSHVLHIVYIEQHGSMILLNSITRDNVAPKFSFNIFLFLPYNLIIISYSLMIDDMRLCMSVNV